MPLLHLPATATREEAVAAIRENGYVIIDNLASAAQMDALQSELAPYVEQTGFGQQDVTGKLTRRTGALIARSRTARELIMNPLVLGICETFFPRTGFHLSLTEVISLSPGAKAQFIHQDELGYGAFPFPNDYWVQISTLWAMSDYTEEMGATRVVPRSHVLQPNMKFDVVDTVPAVMERGSVILYSGKTYHGGGENRSQRVRQAMNIDYAVGWTRQEENQYLATPPEIAKDLPEDLLKVMGYNTLHGWGRVGDWMDPLSYIRGTPQRIIEPSEAIYE